MDLDFDRLYEVLLGTPDSFFMETSLDDFFVISMMGIAAAGVGTMALATVIAGFVGTTPVGSTPA